MSEKLVRPKDEAALVRATVNGILDGRAEAHQALNNIPTEAFAGWMHRDLWDSVSALVKAGTPPDFPSIERKLHEFGKLSSSESWTRYENILQDGHGMEDPVGLSGSVLSLYQRRELIKQYQQSIEEVGNLLTDHLEVAQSTMSKTLGVISGGVDEPVQSGDAILYLAENHLKFQEDQESPGKMIYFGISTLDGDAEAGGVLSGAGSVTGIAGRPGNFKTTWAIQALCETAIKGNEILFISLELNTEEVLQREAAWFTEMKRGNFYHGTYTEFQVGRLKANKPTLNNIHIWAPARATWSRVEAKIRGAALKGIKRVVIDHFGLISTDGIKLPAGSQKAEYKRYIAERMRELAKELKISILLLIQLNREIEKGKAPDMENLRETGALEEVLYSVIVLYTVQSEQKAPSLSVGPDAAPPQDVQYWYRVVKNRDGKSFYSKRINPDGSTCHIKEVS